LEEGSDMSARLSRREIFSHSTVCLGTALAASSAAAFAPPVEDRPAEPFGYCLNLGTIMGQKLSIVEQVEVAARAGWQGVEPWVRDIQRYEEAGESLSDLKKRIADLGLQVASAIGFPRWAVDDDVQRAEGLESFKRDMDLVCRIGGTRIAAPPAGINRTTGVDLRKVAERYRAVLELGREMGVVAQVEIWGSAQTLGTVGEAALVAVAADHPDACLLLDAYHMYKGGSGFEGLKLLNGAAMHAFHINDYPDDPPRDQINDSHRVYPGDGVAPMDFLLQTLYETGFRGMLSLELFNREYWKQDAAVVAKIGLEKTRAAVQKALV
jgi:sugar phosphate isomerase/epimerase